MLGDLVVRTVAGYALLLSILQASAPSDPTPGLGAISQLGATGLLAAGLIAVWRVYREKDKQLMENYKATAESLAANKMTMEKMAEVQDKMSGTLDRINEAVDRLTVVREALSHNSKEV